MPNIYVNIVFLVFLLALYIFSLQGCWLGYEDLPSFE